MANLERFKKLIKTYSRVADFAVIYIDEAHPEDGWSIKGNSFQINNHKNINDRIVAARMLVDKEPLDCQILVDNMEDSVNKAYNAHPERLFIILNNKIVYHGGMGPFHYRIGEVENWLQEFHP